MAHPTFESRDYGDRTVPDNAIPIDASTEEDVTVWAWQEDGTVFIQQGGRNAHQHICEALELFATDVMPEFRAREIEREKRKQEELAPFVEKAMARKKATKPMRDEEIPVYVA